ncbi:MAG: response regulator [Gammaproteobacteria bacterium]|nr:response regulator [Gammaproteobacteria bacterium]
MPADQIPDSGGDSSEWPWHKERWLKRQPRVWLIDDCVEDRTLVNRAIGKLVELQVFHTGASVLHAIAKLSDPTATSTPTSPDMLLLDFRMPRLSGPETLERLRSLEAGQLTPVIVFSSSAAQTDIESSYAAGCNSYVTKPSGWDDYRRTLRAVIRYWLDVSE